MIYFKEVEIMKTRLLLTLLSALAAGAIGLSGTAVAQGQGGGGGGGPGGGGGGGDAVEPDYGDLIILYRNDDGVPVPSASVLVPNPESGLMVDGGLCWQPTTADPAFLLAFDAWVPPLDRVVLPTLLTEFDGRYVIPVDQYTCGVEGIFGSYTEEIDFGRINQARSPESVFEAQLEDVVIKLATADSTSLDPAGRMVASNCVEVDEEIEITSTSTIDSPLQNLAAYRQLMLTGAIGAELPQGADWLDTAARGLGVSSDKGGEVNVDIVAYLNQLMGLDVATTILPKLCETYRAEVQGTIQPVEKCFLDYRSYGYVRGANFGALPSPAYIPELSPNEGWFEYLAYVDLTDPPLFHILQGPITTAVFEDVVFNGGNIRGFTQAADDTRAVINFMHDWPMPDADVFGTPVPCVPSDDVLFDLAISEQSGLQVPKNYVNGGEREFFVNVGNLGPDVAYGTVTVVATGAEGFLDDWTFLITELAVGDTASFTQIFTIDTIGDQIEWNATVVADPPGADPNPTNNTRDATSKVRASGGGGGH